MLGLTTSVRLVWELSVSAQIALCAVLLLKGNFRRIPGFTAYVASNICQAGLLYAIYRHFGFRSRAALDSAWLLEAITVLLRALAIVELLRLILKPYRGIWGLGWRLLALVFGVVLSLALIDTGQNLSSAILLADRAFHLAFALALGAYFILVRYYSIPVHTAYKALLGGFCFYSCSVILANALGWILFVDKNAHFEMVWQLTRMIPFAVVLLVWAIVQWTPLPEPHEQVELGEAKQFYTQLSPKTNERLRSLNEKLKDFW